MSGRKPDHQRPEDHAISEAILNLATARGAEKTICPSEVARHLAGRDENAWRPLMPIIRTIAADLAQENRIDIKKSGEVVDPDSFEGIYRIAIKT